MNKNELIEVVAKKTQLTKKASEEAINAVFNAIAESLIEEGKVNITGFGIFEVRQRAARKGRNPATNEEIEIPASKAVAFKAGKSLKDKVNQ